VPSVPRIQQQVDERALAGTRVPTEGPGIESFGGGQKISQAAGAIGDIALDAYKDAAKNQIMKADEQLTNAQNDLLNNPEYGALNLKGEQAFDAPENVSKAYKENLLKIEQEITNPLAKQAFKRMASEKGMQLNNQVSKHVGNEIDVYNKQLATSYADSKFNYAITNYQNPDIVNESIKDVMTSFDESPAFKGMPQQAKDQMKLEYASKVHVSIIDRMVDNGQDLAAQEYFNANKLSIAGKDIANVEKSLEASASAAYAQREGDKILAQTGSYRQALSMANSMTKDDPKKRQALVDNISRQFNLRKQAEREDQENTSQYIGDLLDKNGGDLTDPRVNRLMSGMTINEKENITTYANNISSGKTIQTDRDYWQGIMEDFAKDPNNLKNYNIQSAEARNKLSRADWDKVYKMKQDIKSGKGSKDLQNFRDDSAIASSYLAKMKIKDKNPKATEFKNKFYSALERFRDENGRKPKDTEMQQIANQLSVEVITEKGMLWDTKKRAFEVADNEQILDFANPEDKKKIMDTASLSKPKSIRSKKTGEILYLNEKTGLYERR
jgi:hypothetical protein